jgi:putative flavoprotein involved in K+ transport
MDAAGLLDERYDEVPDLVRARNLPSMQLVGSPDRATVDLNSLSQAGVQLVGRLAGIRDGNAQFSGSLPNMFTLADLKLERLLDTIDAWATKAGLDSGDPPRRFAPTAVAAVPAADPRPTLRRHPNNPLGDRFSPRSVLARRRRVRPKGPCSTRRRRHRKPGLYLIGMPFLRRRKSTLIDGAAADSADLSRHLAHHFDCN